MLGVLRVSLVSVLKVPLLGIFRVTLVDVFRVSLVGVFRSLPGGCTWESPCWVFSESFWCVYSEVSLVDIFRDFLVDILKVSLMLHFSIDQHELLQRLGLVRVPGFGSPT